MATVHADVEARNQEIYEQSGRFERDRLERQWAFELVSFAEQRHGCSGSTPPHLRLNSGRIGSGPRRSTNSQGRPPAPAPVVLRAQQNPSPCAMLLLCPCARARPSSRASNLGPATTSSPGLSRARCSSSSARASHAPEAVVALPPAAALLCSWPSPTDPTWPRVFGCFPAGSRSHRRLASAARLPGAAFCIAVKLPLLLLLVLQQRAEHLAPNRSPLLAVDNAKAQLALHLLAAQIRQPKPNAMDAPAQPRRTFASTPAGSARVPAAPPTPRAVHLRPHPSSSVPSRTRAPVPCSSSTHAPELARRRAPPTSAPPPRPRRASREPDARAPLPGRPTRLKPSSPFVRGLLLVQAIAASSRSRPAAFRHGLAAPAAALLCSWPSPTDPTWPRVFGCFPAGSRSHRRLASAARLPGAAFCIAVKLPLLLLLVLQQRAEHLAPNRSPLLAVDNAKAQLALHLLAAQIRQPKPASFGPM
nr:COPII coat assembly protein sec16-like [Aegilops tauschii subsp. strangulata]